MNNEDVWPTKVMHTSTLIGGHCEEKIGANGFHLVN